MNEKSGKLYLVGTPIGNLGDITYRAVKTLSEVDFICAEDTRVTLKLLNHLEIKKPLISYQEHSAASVADLIVSRILAGENAAEVTDAGMPCISDPGEKLVRACAAAGIEVDVIPGATAFSAAIALSGMNVSRFAFEGFLSVSKKQRAAHLASLKNDTHTLIFYEAPHKLHATLRDILSHFGNRNIAICRELTKIHQEVIRTDLENAEKMFYERPRRGEFVIIIEGKAPAAVPEEITAEAAAKEAAELTENGIKLSEACKIISEKYNLKKSEIYAIVSQKKKMDNVI
ncbi:MAG: 16S rRNA (cytidine(1402)-2'-O)-methyltransferase [Ruminococcus sp.]|jgi:16S rRNA (cytidine1402-2'-O)-methyltransferase|nr:16S rRNA (cytidine(1402)-2'-O)-methyltransferase [Ruminococcus sp.]